MSHPAIRPTVTQEVRAFLEAEGAAIRPWAGLEETYSELFDLLARRRSDPAFWAPLTRLLEVVVADATDADRRGKLPAPGAELLTRWEVEDLVRDLRASLPAEGVQRARWRAFASGFSATVLGGFLLLGLAAAGCASSPSAPVTSDGPAASSVDGSAAVMAEVRGDAAAGASATPVETRACGLDPSSVLRQTIERSSLDAGQRDELCTCFAALDGNWSAGLTELFASGTAAEIASALEAMVDRCDDEDPTGGQAFADVRDPRLHPAGRGEPSAGGPAKGQARTGWRVPPVPAYKGVSFEE